MAAGQEAVSPHAGAELKAILEALIFASPEPLTPKAIFKLLDTEPKEDVQAALEALKREYDRPGGLQIVEVAGGGTTFVPTSVVVTVRSPAIVE